MSNTLFGWGAKLVLEIANYTFKHAFNLMCYDSVAMAYCDYIDNKWSSHNYRYNLQLSTYIPVFCEHEITWASNN